MLQFIVNICMLFCNLWEISYALISFEPQNSGCVVERLLVPLSVVREKQEWVGGAGMAHLAEAEHSSARADAARPDLRLLGLRPWRFLISGGR